MVLGFSNFGFKNVIYVLAGYESGNIVSLNNYMTPYLIPDFSSDLYKAINHINRFSYMRNNAYDYIFFIVNYFDEYDQIVKSEYDINGYLRKKLTYAENNKLISRRESEIYSDEGRYKMDIPNLWSMYNGYGTRTGQLLKSYDEFGRIIKIDWDFYYGIPSKRKIYFYKNNQEYVFEVFLKKSGWVGDNDFYITSFDIFKLNIFNKVQSHSKFEVIRSDSKYEYALNEFTEFKPLHNEANEITTSYYENKSEMYQNNIETESISVEGWNQDKYDNLFSKAISNIKQAKEYLIKNYEYHDLYDSSDNIEKRDVTVYNSNETTDKFTFHYDYEFNSVGDWVKRQTFINKKQLSDNRLVTEERRDINYW